MSGQQHNQGKKNLFRNSTGRAATYLTGFLAMTSVGAWKFVGRTAIYLIGFMVLCLLMTLLHSYLSGGSQASDDNGGGSRMPGDSYPWPDNDPYEKQRDPSPVPGWGDSIPGVGELPPPDRNFIPPTDSSRVAPNPEDSVAQIIQGQAIVLFNSQNLEADMTAFAKKYKSIYPAEAYDIKYYNPTTGVMLIGFPEDELVNMLDKLPGQISEIDFKVVPNDVLQECYKPSDPGFKEPAYDEYYRLIQAYDAWDVTKGSPDIKVAIVDSYFDLEHPMLKGRYVDPINIVTKTADVYPPAAAPKDQGDLGLYCHGTHVAALAVGAMDDGIGCSGIAPECKWIPISIGDQMSSLSLIEGILYAIYKGADVVNFSIGAVLNPAIKELPLAEQLELSKNMNLRGQDLWEYVVKTANDHNCTLVTAAGNDLVLMGLDSKNRSDGMVKVEAVDGKGKMTNFSNYGTLPDQGVEYSTVAAPGWMIWSATDGRCTPIWEQLGTKVDKKNALQEMPGTSMAAPIVAGAVALMKSKNKDISTDEVIKVLKATGKVTDPDNPIGPTLQIRDALDAVGGEYANFDDLMKDHNLLTGKWKSTYTINLTNTNSGEKTDELWVYFTFDNPNSGMLEYQGIMTGRVYHSPLTVKWYNDRIEIFQQGDAVSSDNYTINADEFVCTPDEDRLLKTATCRNGKERFTFYLQRTE